MSKPNPQYRARLAWVLMYEDTSDAGLTCLRCGISRPTLRHWWRRYREQGKEGLRAQSRARKKPPEKKLTEARQKLILELRQKRKLGPKSLQSELGRKHDLKLSTASIWKVLHDHKVAPLRKPRVPEQPIRYSRALPGERVQMDTMKVAPKLYQFTAVDDCTRMRVLGLYTARTAENAVDFLVERVIEELPFPIQRIQTDRGSEFFGDKFQQALREHAIKFRPIRPGSPHLNGKVERSQQTDRIEFWATADLADPNLEEQLEEWQTYYNWYRPHTSLNGRIPIDVCWDLLKETPYSEEVFDWYEPDKEPFRERDYMLDCQLQAAFKKRASSESM